MNPSNRAWLFIATPCLLVCFVAGVFFAPSRPRARPGVVALTASQTPDDFTAPHKPDVTASRRTPTPDPLPDIPLAASPSAAPSGGLAFWVYQDNSPLYAGAGLNQAVLQRLPCATQLTLLKEEDDWVQVQVLGGGSGWMKRSLVGDHPPPGAAGPRPGDALLSLQGYFQNLNRRDYAKAYDHLSFEFKRDLPYSRFAQGYANLDQAFMRVVRVQTLSKDSQLFYVEMLCEERPKAKSFQGEYIMVLEQNQWHIAQVTLKEVAAKSFEPFPSQTVPATPAFPDPTPEPEEDDSLTPP